MQNFSIKDIENLTGIKAHTLRIWEKRYQLIVSKRKESNHRYFDNEDLKTILRITYLYESEFKISQIAKLSAEAIAVFAHIDPKQSTSNEAYILQLINSILEYDASNFEEILETAINQLGIEKAITEIAYGLLRRIGLLWLTNHLVPAQEHFASHLIQKRLIKAIEDLPKQVDDTNNTTIVFSPPGEFHEIPLLFVHYLFKKNKRRICYLGPNISIEDLQYCIHNQPITHLYFHLITNFTGKSCDKMVNDLSIQFPNLILIASGPMVHKLNCKNQNLICLNSLEQFLQFPIDFKNPGLQN